MYWYAVSTKPHQEHQAELNLRRLGIETFCPLLKQRRVIRRKSQITIGPLFPGYLFAKLNIDDQYRAVSYARGVRRLVTFGSSPAIVDEDLIEAIKSRVRDSYVTVSAQSFTPGQVVRIQEGPLCGLEAIFEREMSDHQRAVLLLRTLCYQARVVVPFEQVVNC